MTRAIVLDAYSLLHNREGDDNTTVCGLPVPDNAVVTTRLTARVHQIDECVQCWADPHWRAGSHS